MHTCNAIGASAMRCNALKERLGMPVLESVADVQRRQVVQYSSGCA